MNEFKGTPAPWAIDPVDRTMVASDVHDVEICTIQPVDNGNRWVYGEETEANAKLISSSPRLLASAIRYLEFRHTGDIGMGYAYEGIHPETDMKQAIAEALGQETYKQ